MKAWLNPLVLFALTLSWSQVCVGQPAPERMALRGHLSSHTGKPLPDTVVIVRRRLQTQATNPVAFWGSRVLSDAHGNFTIQRAEEGEYEIAGEPVGLYAASDPPTVYQLRPGSPPAQVKIGVPIRISLKVLAPDGKSVPGGQKVMLASRRRGSDGTTIWRYDSADDVTPAGAPALNLVLEARTDVFVSCFPIGWGFVDCHNVPEGSQIERTVQLRAGGSLRLRAVEEGSGQPLSGALATLRVPTLAELQTLQIDTSQADTTEAEAPDGLNDIANLFHWEAREREMATGSLGVSTLANLRPGLYAVSLTRAGFQEPTAQLVRVEEGKEATYTFSLKRGSVDLRTALPRSTFRRLE